MLIREWLRRLPPDAAGRFAAASPWPAAGADRDGWAAQAADPGTVSRAAAALSMETAAALRLIMTRYGSLPFEPEQFEAAASAAGLPAGIAARELERLRAAGIVFTVRKIWGDRLHFIASDALAVWMAALLPAEFRPLPGGRRSARPLQDYTEPFGMQLMQLLAELGKRGLVPPKPGGIPGRTAAAAAARLSFGPEALRPFEARFASGGKEEPPLQLGLAAALHLGLLDESDGRLAWRREALTAWLAMDAGRRERELLAFVTDRLAACDERFMHAAALLRSLEGGAWYPAGEIDAWLKRHVPAGAAHWRVWVEVLAAFGWMQTGIAADGDTVIRWVIDPQESPETAGGMTAASAPIRFMPGAELAVPPDLDWRLRWELELLADRVQPGPMTGMRLSAASYVRWVENGRTAEEALQLLEEAAGSPPPDELERSIRDWEASAGRIGFQEALLLVCDDKRIADRIAAEPSVAERLGERIGDRHFLVDRRHIAELRRRLAKVGVPARSGLPEADEQVRRTYPSVRDASEADRAPDSLKPEQPGGSGMEKAVRLLTGVQLTRYAPDLDIRLSAAGAASGAGRTQSASGSARMHAAAGADSGRMNAIRATGLPAHWFSAVRRVHPSTRREMVKRAIEIGAAVRIVREGAEMDILPERLEETDGGWRMLGRALDCPPDQSVRVALDGDSWSDMQLLLPEWIGGRK
ncbi:hypothetical protein Theco_2200 [Thermobacillus composti KWC4]|uniref:Helicase XPB/Ssl2 N-terminal domain-containing protein n=1 Tax=Thermobacillus composti (strain DSM 18247 / JCM 13945 / KWC4) TaxID=717605 RepID=L0EGM5_THECK|nr:helicase-associated domain-containing protein [Thermobacillus composti]AGA58320.1 hypothetical protein Theco_2200 [Thermobacillus composti KWC4]